MSEKSLFKFDTSALEAATRALAAENGKDLARAFNKKMGWLLRRWLWLTPKADYARMARTLGLQLRLYQSGEKVTRTGKVLKFKGGWRIKGVRKNRDELPRIIAMIQKRKSGSPFKGKTRAAGARAMAQAIKRKIGARTRSIGYLKSAIASAQKPFLPFASGPGGGVPPVENDRSLKPVGRPKGFGTLAQPGSRVLAVAVDKSNTKRQGDKGLMKYARPALEKAYAAELADTEKYLNDVLYETARRLGIRAKR